MGSRYFQARAYKDLNVDSYINLFRQTSERDRPRASQTQLVVTVRPTHKIYCPITDSQCVLKQFNLLEMLDVQQSHLQS